MPKFYTRMRRETVVVELIDVEITADNAEEAQEKINTLFKADAVESKDEEDFGDEVEGALWEHSREEKEWEAVHAIPLAVSLDDPESTSLNLDSFYEGMA